MTDEELKKKASELAKRIYDFDTKTYEVVGSNLGRVFTGSEDKCINRLTYLITIDPHSYALRSEIALVGNMARTIDNKKLKREHMQEYNAILKEIMELPDAMGSVDIIDKLSAKLNVSNFSIPTDSSRMVICISRTEGSAGTDIGFALADELRLNYYDPEVIKDMVGRGDLNKDRQWQTRKISFQEVASSNPVRRFSRNHGLPARDAEFFNCSNILKELAEKEDFIVVGRCADVVLKNNNIPHISVYITAPFEQRVHRIMELENISRGKAIRHIKKIDLQRSRFYRFYTGKSWGHADNYDLCINSASYGIEESVNLILRVINKHAKKHAKKHVGEFVKEV